MTFRRKWCQDITGCETCSYHTSHTWCFCLCFCINWSLKIILFKNFTWPQHFPTNMPALVCRADAVYSIGPMLAKHSSPALARHRLHSGAICRHYVICCNDAIMRPVYIKQYWLYTGKTALAQYRPITLQNRPHAGPMLYAQLARC